MAKLVELIKYAMNDKPVQFSERIAEELNKRAAKLLDKYKKTIVIKEDHCAGEDDRGKGDRTVDFPDTPERAEAYLKNSVNTTSIRKMSTDLGIMSVAGIAHKVAGKKARFDSYGNFIEMVG